MLPLYVIAVTLAAALLFAVQPMVAKLLLPLLGGSPAVWNTSMVFFQALLLGGYAYAHALMRLRRWRDRLMLHGAVLILPALALPIALPAGLEPPSGAMPIPWTLATLALVAGLPFFAISSAGPLLQAWFSRTGHRTAHDPYFLYAASNAGSMLGLLSYPLLIERAFTLDDQGRLWTLGYTLFAALMLGAGAIAWKRAGDDTIRAHADEHTNDDHAAIGWRRRLTWVGLAAIPSSLMLGVTQYATTDIAAVPLLWVIPLALYLLTFVVAFSGRVRLSPGVLSRLAPIVAIAIAVAFLLEAREPIVLLLAVHFAGFTILALLCHVRLREDRPPASRLTEFYFWVAVGGVTGGAFNALLAPIVFDRMIEYPIAIAAACLARVVLAKPRKNRDKPNAEPARPPVWRTALADRWLTIGGVVVLLTLLVVLENLAPGLDVADAASEAELDPEPGWLIGARVGIPSVLCFLLVFHRIAFSFGLATLLIFAVAIQPQLRRDVLHVERTFFGVHEVVRSEDGNWVTLMHGTTLHGMQSTDPDFRRLATAYYHPAGPVGDVFRALHEDPRRERWGLLGLGTGAMLTYANAGERVLVIEIDPAVTRIASNPNLFTFAFDAFERRAILQLEEGDGRLVLERLGQDPDFEPLGALFVDAFTSDAIPMHLVTMEAVEIYMRALADNGVLVFHVSNRHLELAPVLLRIGVELGLVGTVHLSDPPPELRARGMQPSTWMMLARHPDHLAPAPWTQSLGGQWHPALPPDGTRLWTDRSSNILDALRLD
ncbi:MAG: hypothetical protein EA378_02260 [Phycisphaerales bacterium]|nr:MAG: hypothetical protein EA378_02260 [Phycisphaerales bacterium]